MIPQFLSSVGVIGGADGPTAVFVTTSPDVILWTSVILTAAAFAIVAWQRTHQH